MCPFQKNPTLSPEILHWPYQLLKTKVRPSTCQNRKSRFQSRAEISAESSALSLSSQFKLEWLRARHRGCPQNLRRCMQCLQSRYWPAGIG